MNFNAVTFTVSVHSLGQLPPPHYPEIAFAGRSNVGKSSLINRLTGRRNLVKVSASPGKTRGLNFFNVDQRFFLVDLPGYGYAKVSKKIQANWQQLITGYLTQRPTLACVVVILDLRHALKQQDRELVEWLRLQQIPFKLVYTKADKLSANQRFIKSKALDRSLEVNTEERILFSAKSGLGVQELQTALASYVENW